MATAILRAWENVAASFSEAELARLLGSASIDRVVSELLSDDVLARALSGVRTQLRLQTDRGVSWAANDLPKRGRTVTGELAVQFNVLNPAHIEAVRALDTKVMRVLRGDVREGFRAFLENGIRDGIGPRQLASQIKDWIGLSPNQIDAVQNFRGLLEIGDVEALTRKLRDRRYDRTLRRIFADGGTLTAQQIDDMTAGYLKKMVAFNASTLARTATTDTLKVGDRLAWQEAIDSGFVPADRVMKRWLHLDGQKDPRPEHADMQGETVPFNQPYSNGDMYAGESDPWNCHCRDMIYVGTTPESLRSRPGRGAQAARRVA